MGRQQCKWYVQRLLEIIGDERILLQCDGYESLLNAIETEDSDGHIHELISAADCTDLCSVPDCEVGVYIKREVNKSFEDAFNASPTDYVDGKVTAKELRANYTKWVADAVAKLYSEKSI